MQSTESALIAEDLLAELAEKADRSGIAAAFRWLLKSDRSDGFDACQLGHLHQRLLDRCKGVRRRSGTYYTPRALVETLLDHALEPILADHAGKASGLRIQHVDDFGGLPAATRKSAAEILLTTSVLDPACGAGVFLEAAAARLFSWIRLGVDGRVSDTELKRTIAKQCLFGIDRDKTAAMIARRAVGGDIRVGDSLLEPLPWPGRKFDVVVGNPPFANAIEGLVSAAMKKRLALRWPELRGTADLAFYFISAAHEFAAPAGAVGLVLPRAVLSAPSAARLRERLLRERPPSFICAPSDPLLFVGANVFVTLVVLRAAESSIDAQGCEEKKTPSPATGGGLFDAVESGGGPDGTAIVPDPHPPLRGDLPRQPGEVFLRGADNPPITDENWWRALFPGSQTEDAETTVGDAFEVVGSMTASEAYSLRPFIIEGDDDASLRFVTTGLIDPGVCLWGAKTCRYLGSRFAKPCIAVERLPSDLARRVSRMSRPKVLVAGLSTRVEAFLDRLGNHVGAVSTYSIFDPEDDLKKLSQLCDQLNSDESAERLKWELGATALGGGRITLTKAFLRGMPFKQEVR